MVSSTEDLNALVNQTLGVCLPVEVEASQLLDLLVRYLQSHPESRHEPARALYYLALRETIPCAVEP